MSNLKNYRNPTRTFTLPETSDSPETSFDIYGLTFSDVMLLATGESGKDLRDAWTEFDLGRQKSDDGNYSIEPIAMKFPNLCVNIIAMAIHEQDSETKAAIRRLPFSTQLEILNAVFDMTFVGEDSLKKTFTIFQKAITAGQEAIVAGQAALTNPQ